MKYYLYVDGASRGNPGKGGAGAYLAADDQDIARLYKYLGHVTNNVAEYQALLLGLREAKKRGVKELTIFSDSELIVRQIQGSYKVKNSMLKKSYDSVMGYLKNFEYRILHIRREKNKVADQLANRAIDNALKPKD